MSLWFVPVFFFVSLLYSSLGFGGGSTYTAVLVSSLPHREIALFLSLVCNTIVVFLSFFLYLKNKLFVYSITLPLVLFSSVGSYLGASYHLSGTAFFRIFSSVLFVNGLLLLINYQWRSLPEKNSRHHYLLYPFYGIFSFLIGFLAGITSIGGGIFLAPFLHLYSKLPTKKIMATSSFFILVNASVALITRRHTFFDHSSEILSYYPLFISVMCGGFIGAYFGIKHLRANYIKRLTGILLIILAVRLFIKSFS